MPLTARQKDLLRRIENGETTFSPESENMSPEQFQLVARALIELEEEGYIEMATPKKESTSGNRYIVLIINCRLVE